MDDTPNRPLVHKTARRIARRATEVLGEEVNEDDVYRWRYLKRIRTFDFGGNICANDSELVEDLTGKVPPV